MSFRHRISDTRYLDISVFPKKWVSQVNMSLWEDDKAVAIDFSKQRHFYFDKFLPIQIAEKIEVWLINKQSQKLSGVKLISSTGESDNVS